METLCRLSYWGQSLASLHKAPTRRKSARRAHPDTAREDKGMRWTTAEMPTLTGRRAIVTGANSGLGFWTTKALAEHGVAVTMAVRDEAKGQAAAETITSAGMGGAVEVRRLDLADLASVRGFAEAWSADNPEGLDLLVNNAGIMAIPRRTTADGFEMQLGTNHLGHFALTGMLWPALVAQPHSRVVTVSSQAHRMGRMRFDDLMSERKYSAWGAYGQSKLANLLFTRELARRISEEGLDVLALAAHPGYASTNLQSAGPQMRGRSFESRFIGLGNKILAQSAEMGALPTLFAATAPGLNGGDYIGPDGFMEQRGHPKIVGRSDAAKDDEAARRLWQVSEELTGVRYPFDNAP